MTLNKQLWISIVLIIFLNSGICFILIVDAIKDSLGEQLYLKNVDNANGLALVLTQSEKSVSNLELLIAAKFDSGHYSIIRLADEDDNDIVVLRGSEYETNVPSWFMRFGHFEVAPGVAQVSDGWSQFGTVHLESQAEYATEILWGKIKYFTLCVLILALVIGAIGSILLKIVLRPLDRIVYQANCFSDRRFITIETPWTSDFARVVEAMNSLANRFKALVLENNRRLEDTRYRNRHDPITGLPNINAFFSILESQMHSYQEYEANVFIMHSVKLMSGDFLSMPKDDQNVVMKQFAQWLSDYYVKKNSLYTECRMARINETDVAVLVSGCDQINYIRSNFLEALTASDIKTRGDVQLDVASAATYVRNNEASHELFDRLDDALYNATESDDESEFVIDGFQSSVSDDNLAQICSDFIDNVGSGSSIQFCDVKDAGDKKLFSLVSAEIRLNESDCGLEALTAFARRTNRLRHLDLALIRRAISALDISSGDVKLAVPLYASTFASVDSVKQIVDLLKSNSAYASRLLFDCRESAVTGRKDEFVHFVESVRPYGVKIGLSRVGESFSQITDVHELGLDYISIDNAFVHDVLNNPTNQAYLRGIADLAHSLGMKVYANGFIGADGEKLLFEIGFDGLAREKYKAL
ncbi:LapD/MoxY N-terminal periplasmic domain-containing protein [Halioxenophilus aromaticivorans]|uniref:LapD/MoxY N-terminal periplasmic domain-containing protein n=1 Tax=Halioxenophilus aromaticivorans TaxID=1306992 RepID=A0AAV3U2I9_9ALTE